MASAPTALLTNKTAIVTGGSRGIGAGISQELARRGANVAIVSTNPKTAKNAKAYAEELSMLGGGIKTVTIQADLADVASPARIVKETLETLDVASIDIVVNNAAAFDTNMATDITIQGYNNVFDVNVRAAAFLVQAALPHIPRGGRIINISTMGTRAMNNIPNMPGMPLYLGSKFGHSRGITANSVSVGLVETDAFKGILEEYQAVMREAMGARTAAAMRSGTPDDIAQVVAFLASDESRWVT